MKAVLKNIINGLPHIRALKQQQQDYHDNSCYPPGHFYSPIVDVKGLKVRGDIWTKGANPQVAGIDLNVTKQIHLLEKLSGYYNEIPFAAENKEGLHYYFNNSYYSYTDGILLYLMMRHFKPDKVIEAGSGFSSALMVDVCRLYLNNKTELFFIEPYPDRLRDLLSGNDLTNVTLIENDLQKVPLSVFQTLEENDILFIDSTHVSKNGQ